MAYPDACFIPSSVKGQELHTLIWGVDSPRAVVQISHGMAEHIARYDGFARFLNSKGIAVVGASHLGHGLTAKSKKNLGFIARKNGWWHMVSDLKLVNDFISQKYPGVPCFLLGHSMGSFLARSYISMDYAKNLSGAIISGTADQPGIVVSSGKLICGVLRLFQGKCHRSGVLNSISFGAYNKQFEPARTEFDWLSRNEADVDKYVADPMCGFCFTLSAFNDLFTGLKYIRSKKCIDAVPKSLPCLFIAGCKDPVGSNGKGVKAVAERFRKAGVSDVTVKLYADDRHEVLNELDRDEVYADILAFIE